MSRGEATRFAVFDVPMVPIPDRNQLLKGDFFYLCQRCGMEWPRRDLRREEVTRLLVCPNDRDETTVQDTKNRRLEQLFYDRADRLGIGRTLDDIP